MRRYYQDLFLDQTRKTFSFATFKQTLRHHFFIIFLLFLTTIKSNKMQASRQHDYSFFYGEKFEQGWGCFNFVTPTQSIGVSG